MNSTPNIRRRGCIVSATYLDGVKQSSFPVTARNDRITYDYVTADGINTNYAGVNETPKRRVASGVEVTAAEPNDPCELVIVGTAKFLHVNETIIFEEGCE